jgi:hypothetical protein
MLRNGDALLIVDVQCDFLPGGALALGGRLEIPFGTRGIVVFGHGSGSSRFNRRNNAVAAYLRDGRLGTPGLGITTYFLPARCPQ